MNRVIVDIDDLITLAEAARLRRTSRQAISRLVKRGRLETLQICGYAFVSKAAVLSFVQELPGRKRRSREA
jgi:hypothetical protein